MKYECDDVFVPTSKGFLLYLIFNESRQRNTQKQFWCERGRGLAKAGYSTFYLNKNIWEAAIGSGGTKTGKKHNENNNENPKSSLSVKWRTKQKNMNLSKPQWIAKHVFMFVFPFCKFRKHKRNFLDINISFRAHTHTKKNPSALIPFCFLMLKWIVAFHDTSSLCPHCSAFFWMDTTTWNTDQKKNEEEKEKNNHHVCSCQ